MSAFLEEDMMASRTFSHLYSAKSARMSMQSPTSYRSTVRYSTSKSTVTNPEAILDIKAGSFWSRGETAFFHVCLTHVNSTCNQNKSTKSIFVEHEKDNKRNYQQRVIDVEMVSPPPPPQFLARTEEWRRNAN